MSKPIREHRLVVTIPIALKAFLGVVFAFQPRELDELGIAGLDLFAGRPPVIGQEVAAIVLDRPVDDAAVGPGLLLDNAPLDAAAARLRSLRRVSILMPAMVRRPR